MNEEIKMHRKNLKIEGDRNLYSYTFTDAKGNDLPPEPASPEPAQAERPEDQEAKR